MSSTFPVCVIGLGKVGYPTARYMSQYGEVWGYDIKKIDKDINPLSIASKWREIPYDVKTYIICVSTGFNKDKPDFSSIFEVCRKIAKDNRNGLISIESTVIPGVSRRIYERIFNHNQHFKLVHVPHRFWSLDQKNYGVRQLRVLGAIDTESLKAGLRFYKTVDIPVHPVSSIEAAEISKIVENTYRFVEISFAESVAMTCKKLGIPFEEVQRACNTLKRLEHDYRIKILEARNGIGGECLPKDIQYLLSLAPNALLKGAILTDKNYKKYI